MEQVHEFLPWGILRAEDCLEHRAHAVPSESVDGKLGYESGALEVGDQLRESRACLFGSVSEGDDDGERGVAASEVEDQLEGGVVAPVNILKGEENWLCARKRGNGLS
jgi:hypothetical protein